MRPKAAELLGLMTQLKNGNAGKVVNIKRTTLFVKSCPLTDAMLTKYKVEREEFITACGEKDNTLSASQVASFAEDEVVKKAFKDYEANRG